MTLQSSGNISLTDLKTEFGGSASPKLTDYYAGGPFVPAGTKNGSGNQIPSSGTIKITDFYGAPNVVISLTDHTVSSFSIGAATASFTLSSDGNASGIGTVSSDFSPEWASDQPNTDGSKYQCRATLQSGTINDGTTGAWLSLSASQTWGVYASAPAGGIASQSATLLIEIRDASTLQVLASATITMNANSDRT